MRSPKLIIRVLDAVDAGYLTTHAIAAATQAAVGSVSATLSVLTTMRILDRAKVPSAGRGRPAYRYQPTPRERREDR